MPLARIVDLESTRSLNSLGFDQAGDISQRSKVSTNFFAIWEDTIGESFVNNIKYYSNFFDLNIINENPKFKDENNVLTYEERAKVFIPPSFIYPSPSYLKLSKAHNDRKIEVFFYLLKK